MDGEEKSICSPYVTRMKLLYSCPNLSWKHALKWRMNWWSKERRDTIWKTKTKSWKENWLLIFQSSSLKTDLNRKLLSFGLFLRQTGLWEPNPSKNVQVFFADSESCERCGDFSTRVGRWSTWNGDVTVFVTHFSCLFVDNWEALVLY